MGKIPNLHEAGQENSQEWSATKERPTEISATGPFRD
jgi:hypothetical protein